jgi:PAS domain S-box-containing protein
MIKEPRRECELESLWGYSRVGCCRIGVGTLDLCKILSVNQYFATTLGYTTDQLIGAHVDQVTSNRYVGTGTPEFERMLDGEIPRFEQTKEFLTKDGKAVPAFVQSFPICPDEKMYDGKCDRDDVLYAFSIVLFNLSEADSPRVAKMEADFESMRQQMADLQMMIQFMSRHSGTTIHMSQAENQQNQMGDGSGEFGQTN